MPIITISIGDTASTVDPSKKVALSGIWDVASVAGEYTTLTSTGSNAISALLQGEFVEPVLGQSLISPYWFGGILPNNDANQYAQVIQGQYGVTTTMPNSQSPLVNYVICEGVFIVEVVRVIDDNNIVVKDPSGVVSVSGGYILTGFSSNSYPIRNITTKVDNSGALLVWLPGQNFVQFNEGTVTFSPNSYGVCSPIMVQGANTTSVLIYNE
jgi:hypothetical protein